MKNQILKLVMLLFITNIYAQSPDKMAYQAIVKNAAGELVSSSTIGMEINIKDASSAIVYSETHTPTTDTNGYVSLTIGSGIQSEIEPATDPVTFYELSNVDWNLGTHTIETKIDLDGGTTYTITGETQLVSVPYAKHASTFDPISITANYTGGNLSHNIMQPYQVVNYEIALQGIYPSRSSMEPYIGQIMMFGGNFAIRGWATCDGQLLAIYQNTALFSILGTTFGGDGVTTFGLPDLRGRTAIHAGHGPGLSDYSLGEKGGAETVTLTTTQIPSHTHTITYN